MLMGGGKVIDGSGADYSVFDQEGGELRCSWGSALVVIRWGGVASFDAMMVL